MPSGPTRSRSRRNVTLDPDAEALLGRVGNASEYLSRTITRRSMQWTAALEILRAAGWGGPELVVACEALNGYWLGGNAADGAYLAAVLDAGVTGASLQGSLWRKRGQALEKDSGLAAAMAVLVDEFWSGNVACQAAVRATRAPGADKKSPTVRQRPEMGG